MGTVAEIRDTIRDILASRRMGPIGVVSAMKSSGLTTVNRTYLADFLKGKKQSLSYDFSKELADFLEVDVQIFRIKKASPPPDIRKGTRPYLYIQEQMDARSWDDAQVASRIEGIEAETIETWRKHPEKLWDWQIQALLHAFDLDSIDQLARPPIVMKKVTRSSRRRIIPKSA